MSKAKQHFPYVSICNSQAEGKYEVNVQVAEDVFVSYYIDAHNLNWLEKDIKSIRITEKLPNKSE